MSPERGLSAGAELPTEDYVTSNAWLIMNLELCKVIQF